MNRIILLLFLLFAGYALYAQENENKPKYDLSVGIGAKYVVFDYLGGGLLELSLRNPNKRLSFNLRQDIVLSLGLFPDYFPQDTLVLDYTRKYGITNLNTQNYLELEYLLNRKKSYQLSAHAGYGWLYLGEGENIRLNRDYGYPLITTAISYARSWYNIELRGDIPIVSGIGGRTSPISLALKYRFRPKKSVQDK